MVKLFFKTSWIVFLLISCSDSGKKKPASGDSATVSTTTSIQKNDSVVVDPSLPSYYKIVRDSIQLPPFEIDLSLSEKAEQQLKKEKETVIVDAMISGIPKDTTLPEYLESGEFSVASQMIELTDSRFAKFDGIKISRSRFDSLANKDPEILINIYSGRRASTDNILDVDFLQKPVSEVMNGKFVLKGKLIRE